MVPPGSVVRRVAMPDAVDVKHMLVLVGEVGEELAEQGRETTAQVSGALARVVERSRRRGDELSETLVTGLRRRIDVVWSWAVRDVGGARQRVGAQVAAVVDELVALGRRQHDEVRELAGATAERELAAERSQCAHQELAALGRLADAIALSSEQHPEDSDTLQEASSQQLHALTSMTESIERVTATRAKSALTIRDRLRDAASEESETSGSTVPTTEVTRDDEHDGPAPG